MRSSPTENLKSSLAFRESTSLKLPDQFNKEKNTRRQGIFWIFTIPYALYECPTELPVFANYICGQQEKGNVTDYHHWQFVVAFKQKKSLAGVLELFPGAGVHAELTRSRHANDYCGKDSTAIDGTQFEFGAKPIKRNDPTDWESIWEAAKLGSVDKIPANIRVVSYRTIRAIAADYATPTPVVRTCYVYWGKTGTGKSRKAWELAGLEAYPKDPRTKFWTGYQGQKHAIFDEFRGGIDIAHMLRWTDRYPVHIEIKGTTFLT